MEFQTVGLDIADSVAHVTFQRPRKLNSFDDVMSEELTRVTERLRGEDSVRVVVLRGAGEHFMGGADIGMLRRWAELSAEELRRTLRAGFSPTHLETLPQPVVAAVDGYALGMGFEVALACDFRIATERAHFGLPEITLGLMPGAGGSQRLPRLVGHGRAAEVAVLGRQLDAATAHDWGVVSEVVAPHALDEAVDSLVGELLDKAPLALRGVKAALVASADETLYDGIDTELDRFVASVLSEDAREGTEAFLDKRPPHFTGD